MHRRRQEGVALMGAIFVLVVLGLLGAYMVNISAVTRETTNMAILSSQTFYAARSGLEYAAYFGVADTDCTTISATGALNFANNRIDLSCTQNGTSGVLRISSEAQRGNFGSRDYSRRALISVSSPAPVP